MVAYNYLEGNLKKKKKKRMVPISSCECQKIPSKGSSLKLKPRNQSWTSKDKVFTRKALQQCHRLPIEL